jgi:hypothetical protein
MGILDALIGWMSSFLEVSTGSTDYLDFSFGGSTVALMG